MEQYYEMKAVHPDAILLYRVGDFYETFGEDAIKASAVLGITLTSRNNGGNDIELAGFPYHSIDAYLPKLVRAGYRVAICEQLEKPSKGKKIVKRGITDVITPGVTIDTNLLNNKKNNFLASISSNDNIKIGLALADISTGEFYVAEGDSDYINKILQSFNPSEILLPRSKKNRTDDFFTEKYYTYFLEDWIFTESFTTKKLLNHFDVINLKGFGIEDLEHAKIAAGSILYYIESTGNNNPKHLSNISRLSNEDYLWMDKFTIRNLELLEPMNSAGKSLFDILDKTYTPMGTRLLRKWVIMPLVEIDLIHLRQEAILCLISQSELSENLEQQLKSFGDLERLVAKLSLQRISPRELKQLERCLSKIEKIKKFIFGSDAKLFIESSKSLNPCNELANKINVQIEEDAPGSIQKGGIYKSGFNTELDELKYILTHSKDLILEIQKNEAIKTGITNLKIGFNSVFGYYLEVTNKYKHHNLIPETWIRKQTMSTGERYITEELKNLESKILNAEGKLLELEEALFNKLILELQEFIEPLKMNALLIAQIDCLLSLSTVAKMNNYCQPDINDSYSISIKNGRHPVIENQLPTGNPFIPNDLFLDSNEQQIIMITGPNMSGKSAILRQTAIICILAQIGSFVPAESASLGITDKVFTRVGASDNISSGESTFMIEMNETASILNNLSKRSLILLDEIGRGTSTYDGISIAWSIVEYLHNSKLKPKTLFATHYHELNELSSYLPRIKNFHVATKELEKTVIFLRKLIPGGSEHSFGIHVAKMAGMPQSIIVNAENKLSYLESQRNETNFKLQATSSESLNPSVQSEVEAEILRIDTQTLSPIEALLKIHDLQNRLRQNN
ncbi:MAG: DNA mismatch repair protein MutS [Saprospiraceae bacterium]